MVTLMSTERSADNRAEQVVPTLGKERREEMPSDQASIAARTPSGGFACTECSSPLIQPMEWTRTGAEEWTVLVRCPECFEVRPLSVTQDQAHQFQNMLDEATHSLQETAEMLDHQVFKESCESFARALRADHICPMDF